MKKILTILLLSLFLAGELNASEELRTLRRDQIVKIVGNSRDLHAIRAIETLRSAVTEIGSTLPGATPGSILYINSDGAIAQDNANLFYDDILDQLQITSLDLGGGDAEDVGNIELDSITGAADAILIGDGADTITLNPTSGVSFSDKNITNVGDAAVDSITADNGSTITVNNDIDLTNKDLNNVKSILFDITNLKTVHVEGQMRWNSDEGVPEVDLPGGQVTGQIFEEMLIRGKNQTGTATPDGKPVYISGASGSNPEFSLSDSDNAAADDLVALFTENIATGANGFVVTFGKARDLDTTGTPFGQVWAVGNRIYVDTTPGDLTNVIPTSNERKMCIGHVLRAHATEGVIFVNPLLTPFLTELSGVSNSAPTDKQLFGYNATNSLWEQTPQLFYDYSNDRLGLNVSSPSYNLHINQAGEPNLGWTRTDTTPDQTWIWRIKSDASMELRDVTFADNIFTFEANSGAQRIIVDTSSTIFNNGNLDKNLIVRGVTDNSLLHADAGFDSVGVGAGVPMGKLHVTTDSASKIGTIIQGAAAQSEDLVQLQDNVGGVLSRFNESGQLGIGVDPTTDLHVVGDTTLDGDLTLVPETISVSAAVTITPTKSHIEIAGNGGAVTMTANPQIAAGTDGDILLVHGTSDSNTVTFIDGNGLHMHGGPATLTDRDRIVFEYESDDSEWQEITRNFQIFHRAWGFSSPTGGGATFYVGGHYDFGAAADDFSPGITHGTANKSEAAHLFLVQDAGDTLGTDTVVRVTGTTINDQGTRATAVNVDITVDDDGSAGTFYVTDEKWLSNPTITKLSGPDLLCNYGFVKYWDRNNTNYRFLGFEATWLAGGNDNNIEMRIYHHSATGWTYNVGAPPTPPTPVAQLTTDHATDDQTVSGESGAWKRDNLNVVIAGDNGEGTIIEVITSVARTFQGGNIEFIVRPD